MFRRISDSKSARQTLLRSCEESWDLTPSSLEHLIREAYPNAKRSYRKQLKEALRIDPKKEVQRIIEISKTKDYNILEILVRKPGMPQLAIFNAIRPGNPKEILLYALAHNSSGFVVESALRSNDRDVVNAAVSNPDTNPLIALDAIDSGMADQDAIASRLEEMFKR